ncbi:uncharacterized protein LOC109427986 isoform X1 [Aedes albopictus]|uniref:CBM39 domain-containing protein n=1 Tax=Aedes albopictus TaxID=7160 RepID=A0ABM1YSN9_AEDAL|nr:uncharacterized protein LOC109427986 [Aedes albopictus]
MVSFSRKLFTILLTLLYTIKSIENVCSRGYAFYYPKPNFNYFNPNGLTVWYWKLPEVKRFEIKIYINRQYGIINTPYDIYLSTSTISYGKFVANDDKAFIRIGDHLQYDIMLHYGENNCLVISNCYIVIENPTFRVNSVSSNCTNAVKETEPDKLNEDVKLLEGIINDLHSNCSNATTVSNYLFLNFRPASANLDSQQLKIYTLKELQKKLPKMDWKTVLVRAFYYNDGVGFEVKSLLDKLKALQMFKDLARYTVTDLDQQSGIEDDNDESSPIIFHGNAAVGKPKYKSLMGQGL